jgi:subtilisin family serine protease
MGVPAVHDSGNSAQDIIIGVFDNGFRLLHHEVFDSMAILATYDFVDKKTSVVPDNPSIAFGSHGVNSLSVIGGYKPGQLVGPAFGASFVLARTENDSSETPFEEDNWIAAIEWADSIGVDVTSTSLVYREYDPPYDGWTWEDMDGNTTMITRAADMAAAKGIVVVNSAGNFGNPAVPGQNTLGAPGDGDSVLTVGAVDASGIRGSFSSVGPTTSNPARLKPDIMARGVLVRAASATDPTGYNNTFTGTSAACPLAAGVAALVLNRFPDTDPVEIIDALRRTASNAGTPDNFYGWGIANAAAAIRFLSGDYEQPLPASPTLLQNYPNPFNSTTRIMFGLPLPSIVRLEVIDVLGQITSVLVDSPLAEGWHEVTWNGRDGRGIAVSSGLYVYRLSADPGTGRQVTEGKSLLVR